jgi:hypothetical protein
MARKSWSSKERNNIKNRFKGFNNELATQFEELKHYYIPDPDLRKQIQSETQKMVEPLYTKFYST